MPVPTIEELKEEIYALPGQLNKVLARKVDAELEVSRLEASIKKLEARLAEEEEQSEEQETGDAGDGDAELLEMEGALTKLEMELAETESRVELDYRSNTPKVTENQVRAAVRDHADVKKLKREVIEQRAKVKSKKSTSQRERRKAFSPRRSFRKHFEPKSAELDLLREELVEAEKESMKAGVEVETLQTKLEAFKILAQLITQ